MIKQIFQNKNYHYNFLVNETDLFELELSQEKFFQVIVEMQNCFLGYDEFKCPNKHPLQHNFKE